MTFLYLVPDGLGEPEEPEWGSWAGRYGRREGVAGAHYYWANRADNWQRTTNRDNTLRRWPCTSRTIFGRGWTGA